MAKSHDKVGYGRPPKQHRFRPGVSGNPSGRKRGQRNLKSDLLDELAETITVQEAGTTAVLTKQRAFVKRILAKALAGDVRVMAQLANLALRLAPPEETEDEDELDKADEAILARFLHRSRRGDKR